MAEQELHYSWPTRLRPHPLLRECTPYNKSGGFRAAVEVVVFPKKHSPGYTVLPSRDYLLKGASLDKGAAAVRFNADTIVQVEGADDHNAAPFSVIWEPETVPGDPQVVGRVHLIGPPWITRIMGEMVERSATAQVHLDSVLARPERMNGTDAPPSVRPGLTDTGLTKSVSIPPGGLRVVSRMDDEILNRGKTLKHELVIAATLPTAIADAADLECEIAVFPKGWVTIRSGPARASSEDLIVLPVPAGWGRPQGGRTGLGSRYISESLVAQTRVGLVRTPPVSRRPASGRRPGEVRVRVLRDGVELCRLHHPFGIEPPEQASNPLSSPSAFAQQLQHVVDLSSDADVARAAGVSVATVRAWLQDAKEPDGDQAERFNELSVIVGRLATVMDPNFIPVWLRKPLRALGDEKPLDVLARGDYKGLSRVVAALESPVAS